MGAQSTASTGTGPGSQPASSAADRLRSRLELDLERQTAALAARRVAFAGDACRTMPLECARAAVEMYRTRRTIEDIEDALGRLDMITQARSCAAWSPASNSRAGHGEGPRLGSDLDERQTGSWSA